MGRGSSILIVILSSFTINDALQVNGVIDDEHNAIIVEADDINERQSRQIWISDINTNIVRMSESSMGLSPILAPPMHVPCEMKEGGTGECMSLKECYPYFKIPSLQTTDTWVMGLYDTCSYMGPTGRSVFGVCCNNTVPANFEEEKDYPPLEEPEFEVEEFPIEFSTFGDSCGFRSIRPTVTLYDVIGIPYIVNGHEAIKHEYPFMAALMNRNRQFCGGSLIDSKHILTAAHCVAHMSKFDVQNLRVRLGDHNIKSQHEASHVEKRVKRVIRHKGFSSTTLWNDVAILTLDEDVVYNNNIQNICLANDKHRTFQDQTVTVAGWGTLKEGGSQPDRLMKVDVKVWANERCKRSYGSSAPGGITNHMLCASERQKDSCSGDSGGPLFDCNPHSCQQIGIVSWGIGCAKEQYPGVYTRVTEMLPWISRIVKEY